MSELKRCPFCGGEAKTIENNHYTDIWSVMCKNCYTESDRYHTENEAISTWNTRKPIENIVEQLGLLTTEKKSINDYEFGAIGYSFDRGINFGIDKAIKIVKESCMCKSTGLECSECSPCCEHKSEVEKGGAE